jgi:hypothetical protein
MAKTTEETVRIGKFDILATYEYARMRLRGMSEREAKVRGMVAAIMGAQIRLGVRASAKEPDQAELKDAAEKKKKTTITAESFDHQVKAKLGGFFDRVFVPAMERFVNAQLSYNDVKHLVGISSRWGAKITGEQFEERVKAYVGKNSG